MTEPPTDKSENQERDAVAAVTGLRLRTRAILWGVVVILLCAYLAADFFTKLYWFQPGDHEWLVAILVGLCIAQVNLIGVWASLAPGNIVLRISWSVLLTMVMWYALILDVPAIPFHTMTRSDAIVLIVILLGGVAVLQMPLWIAKKCFRWRLTQRVDSADASLQEDRQFHLQHLLMAMILISVALSPLHEVLPAAGFDRLQIVFDTIVIVSALILCNLVMTVPCIWWAFASARALVWLVVGWPFYCAALTAAEFEFLYALLGSPGREPMRQAFLLYMGNLSQCAAVLGTLLIFRAIGFRLVRVSAAES
jgi:hypothetical protein